MAPPAEDRLNDLEMRYTHLARHVDELDKVVYEHTRTLDELNGTIDRLNGRVRALEGALSDEAEGRGPESSMPIPQDPRLEPGD